VTMEFRLEVVQVPVSDVERAKAFYTEKAGFDLDFDRNISEQMRVVQLTPPGSACSVVIGTGLTKCSATRTGTAGPCRRSAPATPTSRPASQRRAQARPRPKLAAMPCSADW
jgi:catechol 2,3-dioxygenase-like lactoylglutathione lyase family enzyme